MCNLGTSSYRPRGPRTASCETRAEKPEVRLPGSSLRAPGSAVPPLVAVLACLLAAAPLSACDAIRQMQTACRNNLEVLAGAIALHNSQHETRFGAGVERILTCDELAVLVEEGIVAEVPPDAGFEPACYDHYVLAADGQTLGCLVHGLGGKAVAREQLAGAGFRNAALLAAAWDQPPPVPVGFCAETFALGLLLALLCELLGWAVRTTPRPSSPGPPLPAGLFWVGRAVAAALVVAAAAPGASTLGPCSPVLFLGFLTVYLGSLELGRRVTAQSARGWRLFAPARVGPRQQD